MAERQQDHAGHDDQHDERQRAGTVSPGTAVARDRIARDRVALT